MSLIVSEGSSRVPPENFPSTSTTIAIPLPAAVCFIHVKSVIPKKLDIEHVMVWLCPPTTSTFVGAIWIEGFAVKYIWLCTGTDLLLLWKESLNSDGKQFHQYQQNERSPLIFSDWTQKGTSAYNAEISGPGLRQAQTCGGMKPVNGLTFGGTMWLEGILVK